MIERLTETVNQNMTNWCAALLARVGMNGPMPIDYAGVDIALQWLYHQMDSGIARQLIHDMIIAPHKRYQSSIGADVTDFNLILDIWDKERGYSGDGAILTKMYNTMVYPSENGSSMGHGSAPPYYRKSRWDHFLCSKPELLALKHRKEMFNTQMMVMQEQGADSFLEFGCGEGDYCRMAKSLFKGEVAGIDKDPKTIEICSTKNDGVTYYIGDALKYHDISYQPTGTRKYDIMYASGLFDYLTDDECVEVLTTMYQHNPKFIMVGNANQTEPTKAFLGLLGWELFNRSADDLVKLYQRAFRHEKFFVNTDRTHCMNFLVVDNR